jgi:carboxymethylenebutenolidase
MALANKRFTMTVFDDVGHGFFCEDRPSYAKAAAQQSWKEMIALFRNAL